ncbi:unnamed protein product [Merluccius merluccius]
MTGLVVKDVVCLPRGHLLAHPDRHGAPGGKERAAMATRGMTARIAINCGWSANQMESSLAGPESKFSKSVTTALFTFSVTMTTTRREFPLEVSMGSCDDTQQGQ